MRSIVIVQPDGVRRLRPLEPEPSKRSTLHRKLQEWAERKRAPRLLECKPPIGDMRRKADAELRHKHRRRFRKSRREFYRRDRNGRQVASPPCPISPEKE